MAVLIFLVSSIGSSARSANGRSPSDIRAVSTQDSRTNASDYGTTSAVFLLRGSTGNESESSSSKAGRKCIIGFHVISLTCFSERLFMIPLFFKYGH